MPFDPTGYVPPPSAPPERPRLSPAGERVILRLVAILVLMLLIMPFSAGTFIDVIRYIRS